MSDDRAYRILVTFDAAAERFESRVPELGVSAKGETRSEAIANVEAEIEARLAEAANTSEALPPPADATEPEPGELTIMLAGPLMKDLAYHASRNEMEPHEFARQLLFRAIGALGGEPPVRRPRRDKPVEEDEQPRSDRDGGRGRGRGRGRGGNRSEGYRGDMDDQASFLAYVRDMEKGGRGRR